MDIQVQIVNAFTDSGIGGNPAGVVVDADGLTEQQKIRIAAKVGLSETAFVSSSDSAAFKLDFFTPIQQIAHCGHATIATFSYLRQINRIGEGPTSKETIDGNRDIFIDGSMAFMEQLAPKYQHIEDIDAVLTSLGISGRELRTDLRPTIVNTGNAFLIVPLKNEQSVIQVCPDFAAINKLSEDHDLIGYYIFSTATRNSDRDAGARMFAPRYGIREESATGMAAGPLACFLYDHLKITKQLFFIEQGHLMDPTAPSVITTKLKVIDKNISRLLAGGESRVMGTKTVTI